MLKKDFIEPEFKLLKFTQIEKILTASNPDVVLDTDDDVIIF